MENVYVCILIFYQSKVVVKVIRGPLLNGVDCILVEAFSCKRLI